MSNVYEHVAAAAQQGAVEAVREILPEAVVPDLEIVVNVAWQAPNGRELALGTAVPSPPRPDSMLPDSLKHSAEEASHACRQKARRDVKALLSSIPIEGEGH